jgi:CTP:phosphocholine cytidylyltransferase-like protein
MGDLTERLQGSPTTKINTYICKLERYLRKNMFKKVKNITKAKAIHHQTK